jgi:hypothetical protein
MKPRTKKIILILLALSIVGVFVFFLLRPRVATPPPAPKPTVGEGYKSLVPGESKREDVIAKLGLPLNDTDSPVLNYKSTNPNLPHNFSIEEDTVVFIKEQVAPGDKLAKEDLIELYGAPPETLYGPNTVNGFNLYVYPDKGVAFLGHVSGSGVLEVWYFPPTTTDEFLQTWGTDYSRVHEPIQ